MTRPPIPRTTPGSPNAFQPRRRRTDSGDPPARDARNAVGLKLLGGNFMTMDQAERTPFLQQLATSARQARPRTRHPAQQRMARPPHRLLADRISAAATSSAPGSVNCCWPAKSATRARATASRWPAWPPPPMPNCWPPTSTVTRRSWTSGSPALGTRRPAAPRRPAEHRARCPVPRRRRPLAALATNREDTGRTPADDRSAVLDRRRIHAQPEQANRSPPLATSLILKQAASSTNSRPDTPPGPFRNPELSGVPV